MTMSDRRLSPFAARMSENLAAKQRDGLPNTGGELLIGQLSEKGLGLEWCVYQTDAKGREGAELHKGDIRGSCLS